MGICVFGVAVFISCPSFVKTLDQEGRRAMILQIGNFKGNVIFCRFLSWFLLFEYLFERSDFK